MLRRPQPPAEYGSSRQVRGIKAPSCRMGKLIGRVLPGVIRQHEDTAAAAAALKPPAQATEQVPSVTGGRGPTPRSGSGSAPVGGRGPRSPLRAQRDDLLARDPPAHRHEPDSVSQTRIATRQLRNPRGGPAAHAPARPPTHRQGRRGGTRRAGVAGGDLGRGERRRGRAGPPCRAGHGRTGRALWWVRSARA
jgi:hypothetical protein